MRIEQPSTSISDNLIEAICSILVNKGLVHPGKLQALMPADFPYNHWFKRFGIVVRYGKPDTDKQGHVWFEFVTPDDLHISRFEVSLRDAVKLKQKYVEYRFAALQGALVKMREERAREAPVNLTPDWVPDGAVKPKNGKDVLGLEHAGTDSGR